MSDTAFVPVAERKRAMIRRWVANDTACVGEERARERTAQWMKKSLHHSIAEARAEIAAALAEGTA